MRRAIGLLAALGLVAVAAGSPGPSHWHAVASAYSPADSGGRLACNGAPLTWTSRVVASRTLACGTRLVIFTNHRHVGALVEDRGPFVGGRTLDVAPGVYRALGFASPDAWGVRVVGVRRLPWR